MLAIAVFAFLTPCAVGTVIVGARSIRLSSAAGARGIALQTVIVMVVLLAVAGGVAAVLRTEVLARLSKAL